MLTLLLVFILIIAMNTDDGTTLQTMWSDHRVTSILLSSVCIGWLLFSVYGIYTAISEGTLDADSHDLTFFVGCTRVDIVIGSIIAIILLVSLIKKGDKEIKNRNS